SPPADVAGEPRGGQQLCGFSQNLIAAKILAVVVADGDLLLPATDRLALRLTAGDLSLPPSLFHRLLPLQLRKDFSLAGLELGDDRRRQLLAAGDGDLAAGRQLDVVAGDKICSGHHDPSPPSLLYL